MASNNSLVKGRRSRLSYGILTYRPYEQGIHKSKKAVRAVWDKFDKKDINVKVIDWFIRKVSSISFSPF
jgi:hypothetical protein